jgi:hypothetical protein
MTSLPVRWLGRLMDVPSLTPEAGGLDFGPRARPREEGACWPSEVKVAVNLSSVQFRGKNMGRGGHELATFGLSPSRLELEITESVLLQDSDATPATSSAIWASGYPRMISAPAIRP